MSSEVSNEVAKDPQNLPDEGAKREAWPWKSAKKAVIMLSFCGKKYMGMQRNKEYPTIEEDLLKALRDSGAIAPEWYDNPQKGFFQRASRTDKGVSAVKMIVSLKLLHDRDTPMKINEHLPKEIRVHDIKRVTKNFNCRSGCDARTYLYMLPTFAFCPIEQTITEDFRMTEEIRSRVNEVLKSFVGSHYFHNYTSGKLPLEPSAQRFITEFEIGSPFIRDGLEFGIIQVKGQSFMLHQIRKMIGMAIAVVRGHASQSVIEQTFGKDRIDVPRAPGLGLMLEEVHYENYNRRFGSDGMHSPLTWDSVSSEVESFKEDFILSDIVQTEKTDKSMFEWMAVLPVHTFQPRDFESTESVNQPLGKALREVGKDKNGQDDEEEIGGDD